MPRRLVLGDILVEEGLIAREPLKQAARAAQRRGSPLVAVLLEQGLITEEALVEALCRHLQLERFDPLQTPVDGDAIREVPLEEANRYRLLPLQVDMRDGQRVLRVAMANPLDSQAIEDLEFSTGSRVEPLIARSSQLNEAIRTHYRNVVTKIIPRGRSLEGEAAVEATTAGGASAASSAEAGAAAALNTRRLEALVRLLIRKGLIGRDELDEEQEG